MRKAIEPYVGKLFFSLKDKSIVRIGRLVASQLLRTLRKSNWKPKNFLEEIYPIPIGLASRDNVGFFIHIYYLDYAEKVVERLAATKNINSNNIYISTSKPEIQEFLQRKKSELILNFETVLVPNVGRNFSPLLVDWRETVKQYEYIIHLHSKKSPHMSKSTSLMWSERFWSLLFENEELLERSLGVLNQHPKVGLVSPLMADVVFPQRFSWFGNLNSKEILARRGFNTGSYSARFDFPAGGMFLVRKDALASLFSLEWSYEDFPPETGQLDDTIQHGIERLIGLEVRTAGFESCYFDSKSNRFTLDNSFILGRE